MKKIKMSALHKKEKKDWNKLARAAGVPKDMQLKINAKFDQQIKGARS